MHQTHTELHIIPHAQFYKGLCCYNVLFSLINNIITLIMLGSTHGRLLTDLQLSFEILNMKIMLNIFCISHTIQPTYRLPTVTSY
jgi:hypothetical protein